MLARVTGWTLIVSNVTTIYGYVTAVAAVAISGVGTLIASASAPLAALNDAARIVLAIGLFASGFVVASVVLRAVVLRRILLGRLKKAGVHVWRSEDLPHDEAIDIAEPLDRGARWDYRDLSRLRSSLHAHDALATWVRAWVDDRRWRKYGRERIRVLWIDSQESDARDLALLAALMECFRAGRHVLDAVDDPHLAFGALVSLVEARAFRRQPALGLSLRVDEPPEFWHEAGHAIRRALRRRAVDEDPYPRLVIAGSRGQLNDFARHVKGDVDFAVRDVLGQIAPGPDLSTPRVLPPDGVPYLNKGLPWTTSEIVGREKDLDALDDCWDSPVTHVVAIVAAGGMGKSSVVNAWLDRVAAQGWRDVGRVLLWSFYSQGTRDNLVSAEPFVREVASSLGREDLLEGDNRWRRGIQLAELLTRERALIVLDGLEPMQHPLKAAEVGGQLTDDTMNGFLYQLASADWEGMCLISTRVAVSDLREFIGSSYRELFLDSLMPDDGAELLRRLGVDADIGRLRQTSVEFGGHALALTLLGTYVRDVHNGHLADVVIPTLFTPSEEGGHAFRVMRTYENWLAIDLRTAELAILGVVGLFDRPADPRAISYILRTPEWGGNNAGAMRVGDATWIAAIGALRQMGLIAAPVSPDYITIDAHPLVREYFRGRLLETNRARWDAGHTALYHYFKGKGIGLAKTREDALLLYAAVIHGCAAGRFEEVVNRVLEPRIWLNARESYSTRYLKLIGDDVAALSNFFVPGQWVEFRKSDLSSRSRVLLLANAGVRLRALGRLADARRSFRAAQRVATGVLDSDALELASYAASQTCELLVMAGHLSEGPDDGEQSALEAGQLAIDLADKVVDPWFRMHARSSLAEVNFMLGDKAKAASLFREAMELDEFEDPAPPFLYSQSLYRYTYFLIETGRASEVLPPPDLMTDWGRSGGEKDSLLSQAIRFHAIGATHRALAQAGESPESVATATEMLDCAIDAYDNAGYLDYLIRGLCERSQVYGVRGRPGDWSAALSDLKRAERLGGNNQAMSLLMADVHLCRVRVLVGVWPSLSERERSDWRGQLSAAFADAAGRIERHHYGRRDGELQALELELRLTGVQ